ncbi:MAG: glycosyltransferase [Victivallales bacterium]|nr:glycosyltransferase [Victivallales bacterium]
MNKSRIIYLLGAYPQWSETFVRQDLALLLELGLPLHPVALCPGDVERAPEWPEAHYLSMPGHGGDGQAGKGPAIGGMLPRWLRTRLSLCRHRHLVHTLANLAESLGAEHIHAEFADLPALVAQATARKLGLGYSLSVHARDVHLAKFSPSLIYGRARFVVACNHDAWQGATRHRRASETGVHLIHHGLDLAEWEFREEPVAPERAPLKLAFVGRFVPKKGLSVLFHALARLHGLGMQVRLSLFGSGPLEAQLRALATTLGLAEVVSWCGVVSRDEIGCQMRQHDVLVMPSITTPEGDRDGIPNVVLEAMACGTPVVGSDAGGLPEVLTAETGWNCPAGDDGALAEAIQQLRATPDQTRARCQAARQLVVRDFDARVLAKRRATLFRSVLS